MSLSRTQVLITNGVLFQVAWLLLVQGNNLLAVGVTALYGILHAMIFRPERREWTAVVVVAIVGWVIDSIANTMGVIRFSHSAVFSAQGLTIYLAPLWLLCVWLCFATTLFYGLSWLNNKPWLAATLGFLTVPSSYWVGAKLSGSEFVMPVWQVFAVIAVIWALVLPGSIYLASLISRGARFRWRLCFD